VQFHAGVISPPVRRVTTMRLGATSKIGLALLLPAIGAVVALSVFYSYLAQTEAEGSFINIAGRQRMLSRQMAVYVQMHARGDQGAAPGIREAVSDFDSTLLVLEQGGTIQGRTLRPAPAELAESFSRVWRIWPALHDALLEVGDHAPASDPVRAATPVLNAQLTRLTEASHRLVDDYEAWSRALRTRTLHIFAAIAVFDLLLFVIGVWAARRAIAEHRQADRALRDSEADWRRTFDSITDLVSLHDREFCIRRANKAMANYFGVTPRDLEGRLCYEVFHGTDRPIAGCPLTRSLATRNVEREEVLDPEVGCPMLITTSPVFTTEGEVTAVVHVAKDISAQKQVEQRLQQLAHLDHLTQLPNRALLLDRLNQALTRSPWRQRLVAVLFLDLDRFKIINDTLGHEYGDLLLQAVSERLLACVREGDTVARFGGDEFVVALVDIAEEHDVREIATKILREICRPYQIHGRELFATTSIGISLFPRDATDGPSLIRNADAAMYRAKERGKNNYQFYSPDLVAGAPSRLALENSLRRALERNEFELHYQPRVELASGLVSGAEALLRWRHPERGLIAPRDFIPLLEETGLIMPVGEWILRTACAQARAWQDAGLTPLLMGVNLSARQFKDAGLATLIAGTMRATGLDARWLELEITETTVMEHTEATLAALQTLSGLGIRLAVDDFGTGYSSLAYLKRFPIDSLKIDFSFVREMTHDSHDAAIVQAIIDMGHRLQLTVVAEGVERKEQYDFLCAYRCDEMQGEYFSMPLPPEDFERLLREHRRLNACGNDHPHPALKIASSR
jgi:diguanylate cyclase (GGDEF)-like protein/PAS domain S-box-containing protein